MKPKGRKIQDRPSERTLLMRRARRVLKPLALVMLGGSLLLALPIGWRMLAQGSHNVMRRATIVTLADMGFRVRHVVIDGAITTPKPAIEAALGLRDGMPIFDVAPSRSARTLEQLGVVRQAVVERLLPSTVRIRIDEREPAGIWQRPDHGFALIGTDGSVIEARGGTAAHTHDPGLLLFVGAQAPAHAGALLTLLQRHAVIGAAVIAAEWIDNLRWNLILRDHTVIELPSRHVNAALALLHQANDKIAILNRPVRTIDLRLHDRLIVRPYVKPAAATIKPKHS
jgi:cell division protein FtsQ